MNTNLSLVENPWWQKKLCFHHRGPLASEEHCFNTIGFTECNSECVQQAPASRTSMVRRVEAQADLRLYDRGHGNWSSCCSLALAHLLFWWPCTASWWGIIGQPVTEWDARSGSCSELVLKEDVASCSCIAVEPASSWRKHKERKAQTDYIGRDMFARWGPPRA